MHDVCSDNNWAYPFGHCLQKIKLDESVYLPGEQVEQIVSLAPVISSNCPAKQSEHLVLPGLDVLRPAAHGVQGTVRLLSSEKEFFWQRVQLVAPTKSLNSP